MNSAQYHEEKIFVQVNNRDDKILPFQRQLSNIAWLSAIRLVWPINADRNVEIQISSQQYVHCSVKIRQAKIDMLERNLINKQEIEKWVKI